MFGRGSVVYIVCLIIISFLFAGCDPFKNRDVPEDISGTWGGSITEGAGYYNATFKFNQSGTYITGSWTATFRGAIETGGLSGSYFDGKASFTLSIGSAIIGNMNLRFDDEEATGTGAERGNEFTINIRKL